MNARDFTSAQLQHFNALADSSQMARFISDMNLVREFGNHAIASRDKWAREDAEAAK